MKNVSVVVVGAVVGVVLGFVGSKFLFVGSGLSLAPWALVGLATGIYSKSRKEALIAGAVYGFILSFVFMLSGYNGNRSTFSVLPFFILLGIFGAVCGAILGLIGSILSGKFPKRKKA